MFTNTKRVRKTVFKNFTWTAFMFLLAFFISTMAAVFLMAKYASTDSQNFTLDVTANYYVCFDATDGTLIKPTQSDATWTVGYRDDEPKTATKIFLPGSATKEGESPRPIGELPEAERRGYNLLGWSASNVPPGYSEVEYITSDGNQYIDLPYGFYPTDTIEFVCATGNTNADKFMIAGKTWNDNSNRFAMGGGYVGFGFGFGNSSTGNTNFIPTIQRDKKVHTWTYANRIFEITDLGCLFDASTIGFGSETTSLRLFFGYNSNTAGTVYRLHHTKADGREVKLVPAVWGGGATTYSKNGVITKDSYLEENTVGMYDVINKVFYINSGSGTFAPGPYVSSGSEGSDYLTPESVIETAKDCYVEAHWEPKSLKVTLYNNEGTGSTPVIGNEDGSQIDAVYDFTYAAIPDVTRSGYTFEGWFDASGNKYEKTDKVQIVDDISLYANWTPNIYTVEFDTMGGEPDIEDKEIEFDSYYGELASPSKAGYEFAGWKKSAIPITFTQVEYLKGSGAEYIELPFGFAPEDKVELTCAITNANDKYIISPNVWSDNNRFAMGGVYKGRFTVGYGVNSTDQTQLKGSHDIDAEKHLWTYEDKLFAMPELGLSLDVSGIGWGSETTNIRLFYGPFNITSGTIYSYYHKKESGTEAKLIPAVWNGGIVRYSKDGKEAVGELAAGTAGMYDKIGEVFYINSGSGEFITGPPTYPVEEDDKYIWPDTRMTTPSDHVLYADWKLAEVLLNTNYKNGPVQKVNSRLATD